MGLAGFRKEVYMHARNNDSEWSDPALPAYGRWLWKSAQSLLANMIWIMVSFGGR